MSNKIKSLSDGELEELYEKARNAISSQSVKSNTHEVDTFMGLKKAAENEILSRLESKTASMKK